jgi:ferredoxin--NADP+ reductase
MTVMQKPATPAIPGAPVLPDAKMNLVTPAKPVIGRVVSTRLCMKGKSASFVRHVEIDVSGTPLAKNFLAGQSFGVIPPGIDERTGKPHQVRLYSIACPSTGEDGEGNVVSTTPKRLIAERIAEGPDADPQSHDLFLGVCSNYLCDLQPGDEVKLTGPSGKRFLLPAHPEEHDYLFIATGTGIAPFRGMAKELFEGTSAQRTNSQVHLLMGVPYTTDLLYDDLFAHLAAEHDNFHYHTAISRECRPGPGPGAGRPGCYVDRLLEEKMDVFRPLLESPRTLIYICGLIGMQVGIYTALAAHRLHEQYVTVNDELKDVPIAEWTPAQVKRYLRPTPRCMVEVY